MANDILIFFCTTYSSLIFQKPNEKITLNLIYKVWNCLLNFVTKFADFPFAKWSLEFFSEFHCKSQNCWINFLWSKIKFVIKKIKQRLFFSLMNKNRYFSFFWRFWHWQKNKVWISLNSWWMGFILVMYCLHWQVKYCCLPWSLLAVMWSWMLILTWWIWYHPLLNSWRGYLFMHQSRSFWPSSPINGMKVFVWITKWWRNQQHWNYADLSYATLVSGHVLPWTC